MPNLNPQKWFSTLLPESANPENAKRTRFILAAALLLAAILLFFALRGLNWSKFLETLKNARYEWMPIVFAWGSLAYFMRAVRWHVLIQAEKLVNLREVFWANMLGYLGNNIFPARAGELIRAAYLSIKTQISASFILATGLVERLVDLVALIIIGTFALAKSGLISVLLQKALAVMTVFGIIGLVGMLLLPRFGGWIETIIISLPFINGDLKTHLGGLLQQFLKGLQALLDVQRASGFAFLTMVIWFMDALGTVFMGYILNVHITLLQAFVLLAGLGLSSALPSTPGYVGIYQFVAVLVLVPFGISSAEAVAYILFAQVCGFLIVTAWGALALWQAAPTRINYQRQ